MGLHVIGARSRILEVLSANFAPKRPRFGVHSHVLNHVRLGLGAMATDVALKVVVVKVEHHMPPQGIHQIVLLIAAGHLAGKVGLPGVRGPQTIALFRIEASLYVIAGMVDHKTRLVVKLGAAVFASKHLGYFREKMVGNDLTLVHQGGSWLTACQSMLSLEALHELVIRGLESFVGRLQMRHPFLVGHISHLAAIVWAFEVPHQEMDTFAMDAQLRGGRERLYAIRPVASVWLLSGVDALVDFQ